MRKKRDEGGRVIYLHSSKNAFPLLASTSPGCAQAPLPRDVPQIDQRHVHGCETNEDPSSSQEAFQERSLAAWRRRRGRTRRWWLLRACAVLASANLLSVVVDLLSGYDELVRIASHTSMTAHSFASRKVTAQHM